MADKKIKNIAVVFTGAISDTAKQELEKALVEIKGLKGEFVENVVLIENHQKVVDELVTAKKDKENLAKDLTVANEDKQKLSEELVRISAELGTAQEAADAGYSVVKSGNKTYRITGKKFLYKGRELTDDDLKKDQKLVDELVKIKVGFLTEVKEVK